MRLLYDSRLPQSLEFEARAAPAGTAVDFVRWSGGGVSDAELIRAAAEDGFAGLVLLDRDSLSQVALRTTAREVGIALIAIAAEDPLEAKQRLLRNLAPLRRALLEHDCLVVLANAVRAQSELSEVDAEDKEVTAAC
ncbi:MAG: hypothetical protein OXF61_02035 [Acidimicrobiaceae bacterium]|nr:hypothetical protein [Acidimicrobiaceae bacterium]